MPKFSFMHLQHEIIIQNLKKKSSSTLYILLILILNTAFWGTKRVHVTDLEMKSEICYLSKSQKPFTGLSIEKSPSGNKISEAQFKEGLLDGTAKSFYPSGQVQAISNFSAGKESGISYGFTEDGKKIYEATYKNGNLEGSLIQWNTDGTKKREARYKIGKIRWEIHFKNNLPHGLETLWNENQVPIYQAVYEAGHQIKEVIPDPNSTADTLGFGRDNSFGLEAIRSK
mgnify:CR=1 FL=1